MDILWTLGTKRQAVKDAITLFSGEDISKTYVKYGGG
jgi:hypothetical protein